LQLNLRKFDALALALNYCSSLYLLTSRKNIQQKKIQTLQSFVELAKLPLAGDL
jgi:hypothetical protein